MDTLAAIIFGVTSLIVVVWALNGGLHSLEKLKGKEQIIPILLIVTGVFIASAEFEGSVFLWAGGIMWNVGFIHAFSKAKAIALAEKSREAEGTPKL